MTLTEPIYPSDVQALAGLTEGERDAFEDYMKKLDLEHTHRGAPYGDGSLWSLTGAQCWLGYFIDGYDADEAMDEDRSNAD